MRCLPIACLCLVLPLGACSTPDDLAPEVEFVDGQMEVTFDGSAGFLEVLDEDDRVVFDIRASGTGGTNPISSPYIVGDEVEGTVNPTGIEEVDFVETESFTVHVLSYRSQALDKTFAEGWADWTP
jgi:hypothetical protein